MKGSQVFFFFFFFFLGGGGGVGSERPRVLTFYRHTLTHTAYRTQFRSGGWGGGGVSIDKGVQIYV